MSGSGGEINECTKPDSVEVLAWNTLTLEQLYSMTVEQWATMVFAQAHYKGDVTQGRASIGEVFQAGASRGDAVSGVNE